MQLPSNSPQTRSSRTSWRLCGVLLATWLVNPLAWAHPHHDHANPIPEIDAESRLEEGAWYRTNRAARHATYPWWRGNLHTHTLWSDGDEYPELVVEWYKQNGYQFLALSDHNLLSQGHKWINPEKNMYALRGPDAFQTYLDRYGPDWVETRVVDRAFRDWLYGRPGGRFYVPMANEIEVGDTVVRLKPLNEYRTLFEEPGKFLLVQGEEITDGIVHVNATNLVEEIPPQGGETSVEKIHNNVQAVLDQRARTGQAMLPHLNHPNWRWTLTTEEMAQVRNLRFFELYTGHGGTNHYGDGVRPSVERMWDVMLTKRLAETGFGVVYGLATDDSHRYHTGPGPGMSPGKGWVMVRAPFLTPEHIIHGLESGDFYSTTGVVLKDIRFDGRTLSIEIVGVPGVSFRTQFIGTRRGYDQATHPLIDEAGNEVAIGYSQDIGQVLVERVGNTISYTLRGDEIYVRATITSSELHPNPFQEGSFKKAWVQPIVPE